MFPIQPSPGKQAASARTVSSETAVFVLSHEARHALRRRFGLEDSQLDMRLGFWAPSVWRARRDPSSRRPPS